MPLPTINRRDAVDLFHQLMQPDSEFRVLRLLGEAKIGKSHLMAKVFPKLARETYQAHGAVIDLRNQAQTTHEILNALCDQLSHEIPLPSYYAAYQDWLNRSKVEVKGLQAILSSFTISTEDQEAESHRWTHYLTVQLAGDLREVTDGQVVLFFDALDGANETTQDWIMYTLLVPLALIANLRIVVAGRRVPESCGSYAAISQSFELRPVKEEEEYISYCRAIGATLGEQSIRDFALASDYKPGFFVDLVIPKFIHREAAHG
jgi:hypothetical protein